MSEFTVSTITKSAIDWADMRNSQFIDQSGAANTELVRYANIAYRDAYRQIVKIKENYYTTSSTIVITGGTDTYALPEDFYKLDGVDLALDDSGRALTLRRMQFSERNKFRSGLVLPATPFSQVYRYTLVGNNIRFIPIPNQTNNIKIWYTPEPATITSLDDVITIPMGADEYMALYMACMMLEKEATDSSPFNAKRLEVLQDLAVSLRDRDVGSPQYVVDETTINRGALYPFNWLE